ncbi:hypothetical protein FYM52_15475 [Comamonas sp. CAH-2]|jgi:hypothetical protein|uniref:hypothetical protein n=1 Tax=Comamonas sp. CAH-2 TaxID=2605745 RepID=UPI0012AE5623|nr:hypothetical protein [Comamonas sp. CAH-2]MRT21736.1 hypothetical protein [Comamonas sp. CAH-2]
MWQEWIVGVVVALAAVSLLWRYLPRRWRQHAGRWVPALAPVASKSAGCGGCSGCEGARCAPAVKKP